MKWLKFLYGLSRLLSYTATGLLELSSVLLVIGVIFGGFHDWELVFVASMLSPVFAIAATDLEFFVIRKG